MRLRVPQLSSEDIILKLILTRNRNVIRACIFDLDGVIVDTAHYHYLAWKRLADGLGYHLTEKENEQLKGVSRMQSLDIILQLAGISLNQEHKEILASKKNTWFNEYLEAMSPDEIFPGVFALIERLKKEGIKVGLASSSKNARTVLRRLRLEDVFEAVVDGDMISRTKPDPEIFLIAARMLGVDQRSCLVVEDAEAGVEAALAAGMKCIGIGSQATLGKAHLVFERTSDIDLSTLRRLEAVQR
jgi:beta-phosphoglucomutase